MQQRTAMQRPPTTPNSMVMEADAQFSGLDPEQHNRELVAVLEQNLQADSQQLVQQIRSGQVPSPAWLEQQLQRGLTPEARALAEQRLRQMLGQELPPSTATRRGQTHGNP